MTPEEAKKLLSARRPNCADDSDVDIRAALEQAQTDATLNAWQQEEAAFDAAFSAKLTELRAPEGLKERILAAASEKSSTPAESPEVVPFDPQSARSESGLGNLWSRILPLAAALVLLVALAYTIVDNGNTPAVETGPRVVAADETIDPMLDKLFSGMVEDAELMSLGQRSFQHDYRGQTRADLLLVREDLTSQAPVQGMGVPAPEMAAIPGSLHQNKPLGCRAFIWNGRPVGSVCIGGEEVRHLYWGSKESMDSLDLSRPLLTQRGEHAVAVWEHGDQFYVLVIDGSVKELEELLRASEV
ncbi:MAG: hypothetical protein ACFBZ8_05430 [Opitutales bacterium]